MTEKIHEELQQAYCHECYERMVRAQSILEECDFQANTSECLDRLHQEFDSLVGASRAVHYPLLEKFNRHLASYSRLLRNRLPLAVLQEHIDVLQQAIELGLSCDGSLSKCLSNRDVAVQKIIEQIESLKTRE